MYKFCQVLIKVHFTGEDVPLSAFCMTNKGEWDKFRHIDMDKEVFSFSYAPLNSRPQVIGT